MALFLALLLAPVFGYIKEGEIFELVGDDLDNFLSEFKNEVRVINLYAPFSFECKKFSSTYFKAAKELAKAQLPAKLAKLDLTNPQNKFAQERYRLTGMPNLVYYMPNREDVNTYNGLKTEEHLIASIKEKAKLVHEFFEVEELDKFLEKTKPLEGMILGVFEEFTGEKYQLFEEFARNNTEKYLFGKVKDQGEWSSKFNLDSPNKILILYPEALLTPKEPQKEVLSSFSSVGEIQTFVEKNYYSQITWVGLENLKYLTHPKRPIVLLLMKTDSKSFLDRVKKHVEELYPAVKKDFRKNLDERKFLFALGDIKEFESELQKHELKAENLILLIKVERDVYVLQEEDLVDDGKISESQVKDFLKKFNERSIDPYLKSQKPPKNKYENGVKVVVSQTIRKDILKTDFSEVLLVYKGNS